MQIVRIVHALACAALIACLATCCGTAPAFAQKVCFGATGEQIAPCTAAAGIDAAGVPLISPAKSIAGSFAADGTDGKTIAVRGQFNVSASYTGGVAGARVLLLIERSFDAGATWFAAHQISASSDGTVISLWAGYNDGPGFGLPTLSATWSEPEAGVLYRARAVGASSGTLSYRISH